MFCGICLHLSRSCSHAAWGQGISVALIKFCSLMLLVWFCGFQTWGEMENLICSTFVVAYQYKPGFSAENKTKRCILNHSHRLKAAGTANCTEQRQHA